MPEILVSHPHSSTLSRGGKSPSLLALVRRTLEKVADCPHSEHMHSLDQPLETKIVSACVMCPTNDWDILEGKPVDLIC